jgi:signal transduction histidine kinase
MSPAHLQAIVIPLVVAAFVAGHAIPRRAARNLRMHALHVQRLASTSRWLTTIRGDLLAVGAPVRDALHGESDAGVDAGELAAARSVLRDHLAAVAAFPPPVARDLPRAVADADAAFGEAGRLYLSGDIESARRIDMHTPAHRADLALATANREAAGEIDREAAAIVALHARLRRIAPVPDAIAAVFALTLLGFAVSSSRRHARLVDERKRDAERRAEELELFAGRVAHDIRNPVTAAALQVGLLRRSDGYDDKTARRLEALDGSVRRINGIIDDLLAFARAGGAADLRATSDVTSVVTDVLGDFDAEAQAGNIELVVGRADAALVACPEGQLASMLGNLVRNAMKYIGDRPERRVSIEVTALRGDVVRIEVADTGPGIPEDRRDTIFEPFVRIGDQRVPGIGLGLATVKRLVQAYGGRVGIEPRAGGGSRFWLELPTVQPDDERARLALVAATVSA